MGVLRLAWRLRRHRGRFAVVVLASIGALLTGVAIAALSVGLAVSVARGAPSPGLGILLAVAVLAAAAFTWVEQWVAHVLAYRVIDSLRIEVHRAIARLAPLGLARSSPGETVARAIGDAEALEWFYAHTAAQVVAGTVASGALSLAAIVAAGPAGLLVPAAQLLLVIVPVVTARAALRQGEDVRERIGALGGVALSARRFARETVLLGGLDVIVDEMAAGTARIQRARRSIAVRLGLEQAAAELIAAMLALGAVGVVAAATAARTMDPAVAPVAIAAALASTGGAVLVATAIGRIGEVRAAADRIERLLDSPASRPDAVGASPAASIPDAPALRIEGVRVGYPVGGAIVLDGFDLVVERGTTVALVGASGAGKSTALLAAARLIPIHAGGIAIDGADIQAEPATATRGRVSFVGQHAHVFRSSVRDNLLAPDAGDAEIWSALGAAVLADRVRAEPDGLDAPLQESGATWSGGERQRLGLARGLIRDAGLLLLDEPTAGLDPEAERAFLDALRAGAAGRSVLVTTHREPVMRAADRVALLAGGRIVDEGTHDELRARSTEYRRLLASGES